MVAEVESEAATRAVPCEEIVLAPLLDSLARQFEQDAGRRGISVLIEDSDAAVVKADSNAIERILVNLIDNAIKHGRSGGTVRLSVRRCGEHCEIRVADDGPGIPEEDIPRLFERFFRVDKSRSRAVGGAGLGLAIARSLCESQGGNIRYEQREGGGSVFIVRLPSAPPHPS
jgi:two-component system sensor histidine kinase VicK